MSGSDDRAAHDPDAVELLPVAVGGLRFAVETGRVAEVTERPEPTRVPQTHPAVEGVVEVDGRVTAVLDGGTLFDGDWTDGPDPAPPPGAAGRIVGEETNEESGPDRLLVFDRASGGEGVALRVDTVDRVEVVGLDRIDRNPRDDRLPEGVDPDLVAALVRRDEGEPTPVLDVATLASLAG